MKKHTILLGLLVSTLLLQGCAALVVGGAAGTAKASGDRRTLGAQWDDQTIELKAANLLADNKPLSAASKISVYSNNGRVLLVGQTPSDVYKIEAAKLSVASKGCATSTTNCASANLPVSPLAAMTPGSPPR